MFTKNLKLFFWSALLAVLAAGAGAFMFFSAENKDAFQKLQLPFTGRTSLL